MSRLRIALHGKVQFCTRALIVTGRGQLLKHSFAAEMVDQSLFFFALASTRPAPPRDIHAPEYARGTASPVRHGRDGFGKEHHAGGEPINAVDHKSPLAFRFISSATRAKAEGKPVPSTGTAVSPAGLFTAMTASSS